MSTKKKAGIVFLVALASGGLVILHAAVSDRKYLCTEVCNYIDYKALLGALFLIALFIASIAFVRLLTSDHAFRAWKLFMLFFVPIGAIFALPAFMGGGGGWAISSGPDSEITVWLLGIVYALVSIGIIVWYAVRERRERIRTDSVKRDWL